MTASLDPAIEKRIKAHCAKGYERYDALDYNGALRAFYQAWLLLPKPQTQFVQAGWVLTALADAYQRAGKPKQAIEAAQSALCCPDAEGNWVALMRLGQSQLDLGDISAARVNLSKVYAQQGAKPFAQEDADYLNAIADLTESGHQAD